jgi:PAS domain S-box-containing protein
MPSALDASTLYVACAVVFLAQGAGLLLLWWRTRLAPEAGLSRLLAGYFAVASGFGAYALASDVPSVVLGNALLVLGAALVLESRRLFFGLPAQRLVTIAAVAIAGAFLVLPGLTVRAVTTNLVLGLLLGRAAWIMLSRGARDENRLAPVIAASGLSCLSLLLGGRAVLQLAGFWRPLPDLRADGLDALSAVVVLLAGTLWPFGILVSLGERLSRRVRESEHRYRSLVETSPDLIYRADAKGRFTYANPAAARIMGYSPEGITGRRYYDFVRPDHRQRVVEFYERQAAERIQTTYLEFPALARDGHEVWIGQNVQVLTEGDRVSRFEVIARDLTEQRRAEQRFSRIFEAAPDAMLMTNREGLITMANDRAERVFGYGPGELLGREIEVLVPSRSRGVHGGHRARYSEAPEARSMGAGMELYAVRKDGTEFPVEISLSPVDAHDGALVVSAIRDVTDRRKAEAALAHQKGLLEGILAIARATSEGMTLDEALRNTLDLANSLTGATSSSALLLDETGTATAALFSHGQIRYPEPEEVRRVMNDGLAGWVARHRESALVADVAQDERWAPRPPGFAPIRSVLSLPIQSGKTLVGIFTLDHPEVGHFTEDHRGLMEGATAQIALALRNAQVSDARLQMADQQALLYEVQAAASRELDPLGIADLAAAAIARRRPWAHVVVALPGEDEYWILRGQAPVLLGARMPLRAGVIGRAFSSGQVQHVSDVTSDADYVPGSKTIATELAVPMRAGDRTLGVLNLESENPGAFGEGERRLALSLADAVALCLENARLYREIGAQRARLAAVVESSRDGLVLIAEGGHLLLVSEPALRLLELSGSPEDWFGRPFDELCTTLGEGDPRVGESLRGLRPGGIGPHQGEIEVSTATLECFALPVPAVGSLLVLRDVTQERLAKELREDLTHALVHDLRNPLLSIGGALELLAEVVHTLPEGTRPLPQMALRSARRLETLVTAILDVGRLESGQMPLRREAISLADLVARALDDQRLMAERGGLGLRVEIPGDAPLVSVDPDVLVRVIVNLVGNAIKFVPEGGTILVSGGAHPGGGAAVDLVVSDDGPGLPPEVEARLFRKFVVGSQKGHGTGLGLAFCRLAVEAHGGRILGSSRPQGGTTFTLTLPAAPPDASALSGERRPASAPTPRKSPGPLKVLVADDDPVGRQVVRIALLHLGHQAGEVGDGEEVLEALRSQAYDVVFMDLDMPVLDGIETARRIVAEFPPERRPRLIAMTASTRREEKEQCLAAGMSDYLVKPLTVDSIRATVGQVTPA